MRRCFQNLLRWLAWFTDNQFSRHYCVPRAHGEEGISAACAKKRCHLEYCSLTVLHSTSMQTGRMPIFPSINRASAASRQQWYSQLSLTRMRRRSDLCCCSLMDASRPTTAPACLGLCPALGNRAQLASKLICVPSMRALPVSSSPAPSLGTTTSSESTPTCSKNTALSQTRGDFLKGICCDDHQRRSFLLLQCSLKNERPEWVPPLGRLWCLAQGWLSIRVGGSGHALHIAAFPHTPPVHLELLILTTRELSTYYTEFHA